MGKLVDYYFAPQSPWTYLGHARFVALCRRHGARVEAKPCDLGKIFPASGGVPLGQRAPQRQAYRLVELKRWSEHLQIPLNLHPAFFPVPADSAARLILACKLAHGNDGALDLAGAVMRTVWAEERNIADDATLAALANQCGFDGHALLQAAHTAGVHDEYERNTQEAIAANVFGSPWYVVDGEGYWGQDRLDFVERALAR
jgi:2-hydroxychromene-2-carboxylate isomerase